MIKMDKKVNFYNHLARSLSRDEVIKKNNEYFQLISNFYTKIENVEDYIKHNLKEMYFENPNLFITYTLQYLDWFDFLLELNQQTDFKYYYELEIASPIILSEKIKKILVIEKISIYNLSCKMLESR